MSGRFGKTCVLLTAIAAAAPAPGCGSTPSPGTPQHPTAPMGFADPARRPGLPLVFIAMPGSAPFQTTRKSLVGELGKSYDVSTFLVDANTTPDSFRGALERAAPTCIVLMNNTTVRLYRDYQRARPGAKFPPAIVVMTSFLEDVHQGLIDATGISYEVPGVTAFVGLRATITAPVSRVGVIHARDSEGFIERQRALAAKEHITLFPVEVGTQPTLKEIRNAFRFLREVNRIDALWILNDNRLLRDGRFIVEVWQPQIEALKVPVIVGAAPLINAQSSFGTFAVLPDHGALGVQAANLILDISEDDWRAAAHPLELPLSTITILDVANAKEKFGLRADALNHVDVSVE